MRVMIILSCEMNYKSKDRLSGTRTLARLEKALQMFRSKGRDFFDCIVVSGGAVNARKGHPTPHAQIMKKWLVSNGVPEEMVFEEGASLDTYQNIENTLYVLKNKIGLGPTLNAVYYLVTEENHARRAILTFNAWTKNDDPNSITPIPVEYEPKKKLSKRELFVEKCMYLLHKIDPKGKTLAKLNQRARR